MIQEKSTNNGLSTFTLKCIAIVTMALDHGAAVLLAPNNSYYLILRLIGRTSFPIFCFLIAEGAYHTKNIKQYALRLGIFALISELPFNLAFYGSYSSPYHQNVFFTLFLGLIVIAFHKLLVRYNKKYLSCLFLFLGMYIASLMKTDYGAQGVLLIYIFYISRNITNFRLPIYILGILMLSLNIYTIINSIQIFAIISIIPIFMYNGGKGKNLNKYAFYSFYPVHLIVLYFLAKYI
ncbi:TraX family protein [Alloiococcus sp. CFN-8]|uniref:TraX family protein n=1 Tax=Alloiococcus sp. CFN-8 TaxID=3416081 RepID=UPI003CECE0B6